MNVFYINRKKIYAALLLLILIYTILFYMLSLKVLLTKNEVNEEISYIN
ncbi:MAG: hypothetical protein K0R72_516 [Clostridia bacterium]|jgi:hypothetical protein|nr:hypothetical protein [Clostridia bacterium]